MKPMEAVEMLDGLLAKANLTRDGHKKVEEAIETLRTFVYEHSGPRGKKT